LSACRRTRQSASVTHLGRHKDVTERGGPIDKAVPRFNHDVKPVASPVPNHVETNARHTVVVSKGEQFVLVVAANVFASTVKEHENLVDPVKLLWCHGHPKALATVTELEQASVDVDMFGHFLRVVCVLWCGACSEHQL
jgi:hypothetical protein